MPGAGAMPTALGLRFAAAPPRCAQHKRALRRPSGGPGVSGSVASHEAPKRAKRARRSRSIRRMASPRGGEAEGCGAALAAARSRGAVCARGARSDAECTLLATPSARKRRASKLDMKNSFSAKRGDALHGEAHAVSPEEHGDRTSRRRQNVRRFVAARAADERLRSEGPAWRGPPPSKRSRAMERAPRRCGSPSGRRRKRCRRKTGNRRNRRRDAGPAQALAPGRPQYLRRP
jgi:hypothetical protein